MYIPRGYFEQFPTSSPHIKDNQFVRLMFLHVCWFDASPNPLENNLPSTYTDCTIYSKAYVCVCNVNGKVLYTACRMLCSRLINTQGVCYVHVGWPGRVALFGCRDSSNVVYRVLLHPVTHQFVT